VTTIRPTVATSSAIEEGQAAPDFELESDAGDRVRLSSLRGQPVVLFFYPKSDTPGCTRQACGIRDTYEALRERGAVVLGVSVDDRASQARFKEKYGLPFPVLADPQREAGELYGVVRPDSEYFERSTFIIDADGKIARVMRRVDPESHADKVVAALPE
jgi:peroxiredoxin Q/BCP